MNTKSFFIRGCLGMLISVTVSLFIRIIKSIQIGDGLFHPVTAAFADKIGSELNAFLVQIILFALLGIVCGIATLIHEINSLGVIAHYGIYMAISIFSIFLVYYVTYWIEHTLKGVVVFGALFVVTYILVCFTLCLLLKDTINRMNQRLEERNMTE